jgi:hypothetical protein
MTLGWGIMRASEAGCKEKRWEPKIPSAGPSSRRLGMVALIAPDIYGLFFKTQRAEALKSALALLKFVHFRRKN